ncbi:DUF4003 family protein [Exiguobacterium sp. s95]|uniref:DUF4003 family protein n=1 Tax=Exiguobacterium sp. s95 TaxID=2751211 RepID=UPI001BE5AEC5|nr:DUF4003 family protein [Exiguobacterium sp. s95]
MEESTRFLHQLEDVGQYFVSYQDNILIELAFDQTIGHYATEFSTLEQTADYIELHLHSHQTQALLLASKIHAFDASPFERITEMMSIQSFFATHRMTHPANAFSTALLISRLNPSDAHLHRTLSLYRLAKKQHRFIVSPLLGSFFFFQCYKRGEVEHLLARVEDAYDLLKKRFGRAQQTYIVALLFSLLPEDDFEAYVDQLRASHARYRKSHIPLAFHGLLALLGDPAEHASKLDQIVEQLRSDVHFKHRKDLLFLTAVRLYLANHPTLQQLFAQLAPTIDDIATETVPFLLFPIDITDTSHATDGGMVDGGFDGDAGSSSSDA